MSLEIVVIVGLSILAWFACGFIALFLLAYFGSIRIEQGHVFPALFLGPINFLFLLLFAVHEIVREHLVNFLNKFVRDK